MTRFRFPLLLMLSTLIVPLCATAASYCIKVNGGFGNGGTSFIGRNFVVPAPGDCKPWSGFTKAASSVIAMSTGSGCLSSNGKVLTLTIFSTDPPFLGSGVSASDHIRFCPAGVTSCPISGQDFGTFGGPAAPQGCTAALLALPALHD
jgi:hypothetical protein